MKNKSQIARLINKTQICDRDCDCAGAGVCGGNERRRSYAKLVLLLHWMPLTHTHTNSQTLAARLGALPELLLLWLLYNTFREARNILLTFMTYRAVGPNSWPSPACLVASPAALAPLPHELKKRTNARHAPVCVFTSPLFAAPAWPAANRAQSPAWLGVSFGLNKFITERSIDRLYVPPIVCRGSRGVVTLF